MTQSVVAQRGHFEQAFLSSTFEGLWGKLSRVRLVLLVLSGLFEFLGLFEVQVTRERSFLEMFESSCLEFSWFCSVFPGFLEFSRSLRGANEQRAQLS